MTHCQALDLHQVQRARFQNGVFLWFDQLAFDLSGVDQDQETKVTVPDVAMGVSSDSFYASHSLQGTFAKFHIGVSVFSTRPRPFVSVLRPFPISTHTKEHATKHWSTQILGGMLKTMIDARPSNLKEGAQRCSRPLDGPRRVGRWTGPSIGHVPQAPPS